MASPLRYNVTKWLEENEKFFVPPICNKLMFKDGQLKTFFVGGPNSRKDFHMEEGEEFFYMLKGDMKLVVHERGAFKDIIIREGEVFLLPPCIPHSPQRFADTIGLVIERERTSEEMDCLRYYVKDSDEVLYEKWFHCYSLEELGPLIKEYFASEAHRTGKPTPGTIPEEKPLQQNFDRETNRPFSLEDWMLWYKDEIDEKGKKKLFEGSYQSRIYVLGEGLHSPDDDHPEIFLWQTKGESEIDVSGKEFRLLQNETMLIPKNNRYTIKNGVNSRILSVVMNPVVKK